MKKLQNNFTNINQIIRLLELGVPADSADMYVECYWCYGGNSMWRYKVDSHEMFGDRKQIGKGVGEIRPCWSVGRLIEIYQIVGEEAGQCISCSKNQTQVESLVQLYEENIGLLDFSKLEE